MERLAASKPGGLRLEPQGIGVRGSSPVGVN
jgi:hypothetical protein